MSLSMHAPTGVPPHHDSSDSSPPLTKRKQQDAAAAHPAQPNDQEPAQPNSSAPENAIKRPKKEKKKQKQSTGILHTHTFRNPRWKYIRIRLVTPDLLPITTAAASSTTTITTPNQHLSPITVSSLLTPPLTTYLGTTGAAIPLDILCCAGRDVFLRLERDDARALRAALSAWTGWCGASGVPGLLDEGGKVRVAWRFVSEGGSLGGLGCGEGDGDGDGVELFGS